MSGIKMKRKVVMTITADETNAGGLKVKFVFVPDVGGVRTHQGLKQAVMALMALVNNEFETPPGKAAEENKKAANAKRQAAKGGEA